jgi:hypothetical protein
MKFKEKVMQKCDMVVRNLYIYLGINTAHKLSLISIKYGSNVSHNLQSIRVYPMYY